VTGRNKGFSLIEVIIVMAMIALALTIAGPRIGAGIGRLELEKAALDVRGFVTAGRIQAQRTDREHYLVINQNQNSITLLDPEMTPIRQATLPESIQIELQRSSGLHSAFIAPSGIVRGEPVRLKNGAAEIEVILQ
jgi:general secretion pathway protein H